MPVQRVPGVFALHHGIGARKIRRFPSGGTFAKSILNVEKTSDKVSPRNTPNTQRGRNVKREIHMPPIFTSGEGICYVRHGRLVFSFVLRFFRKQSWSLLLPSRLLSRGVVHGVQRVLLDIISENWHGGEWGSFIRNFSFESRIIFEVNIEFVIYFLIYF